ncbi:glycosyltransferase family 2 protein [Dactylosporangium sp. NPDC000555]|uniref:glycosyltransferase family 2 protein n=1 Tax=Dactylosporangium sp. NPDC000555 TaxID=3154260 RepID=UPI003318DF42
MIFVEACGPRSTRKSGEMLLSVIVPCFNETATLERLHTRVSAEAAATGEEYEVIYIDDGSSDDTLSVMRRLAESDDRVRYASFSRNFGKESALLAGLKHASGDAIIIMDADLQHPPELIPRMVEMHRQGFDQVIARRNRQGDPFARTLLSSAFYRLVNRWIEVRLVDGAGDFRLISRRVVDSILSMPEYNRFSKAMFVWVGFEVAFINYENVARQGGTTKWTFGKLFNYAMDGLLSFNNKPLRLAIYLGLGMSSIALAYMLWIIGTSLLFGIDSPGYVTLLAAVVGLGGLNMIVLGVIGEYVGRIYYEAKNRPHFLLKEAHLPETSAKGGRDKPPVPQQRTGVPRQKLAG